MILNFSYISEIIDNKEMNRREKNHSANLEFINGKRTIIASIYPSFCSNYRIDNCKAERVGKDDWGMFNNLYTSGRLMIQLCYADNGEEINGIVVGLLGANIMYYLSK